MKLNPVGEGRSWGAISGGDNCVGGSGQRLCAGAGAQGRDSSEVGGVREEVVRRRFTVVRLWDVDSALHGEGAVEVGVESQSLPQDVA